MEKIRMNKAAKNTISDQYGWIKNDKCRIVNKDGSLNKKVYNGFNEAVKDFNPVIHLSIIRNDNMAYREDNIAVTATLLEEFSAKLPYGVFFIVQSGNDLELHRLTEIGDALSELPQLVDENEISYDITLCSPVLRSRKDATPEENEEYEALRNSDEVGYCDLVKWLDMRMFDQRHLLDADMAYPWNRVTAWTAEQIADLMGEQDPYMVFDVTDGKITLDLNQLQRGE